MIES
ncbi:hypothetical protein LINPERPRIM_LOCUS37083 [Linum perenne]|jgi:hypothetical protein